MHVHRVEIKRENDQRIFDSISAFTVDLGVLA